MEKVRDKTLALAGIFQSAALVHQLASKGTVDMHDLSTCISSTLELNPLSTLSVYGKLENLRTGLHTLIQYLGEQPGQRDPNVARYVISLLHLQRKLGKRKNMLATIAEGIQRAKKQSEIFGITHDNVIANLAGVYSETISNIPPKIMVSGESSALSNPDNANKIRAILLAGIRSAVLWSQLGGTRWQILFSRRTFIEQARTLLSDEMNLHLH
ncbi:MAG: high frequency lysogenization protein HflD [Gammaproteobacteria bacterium]|nr:high frequency lysogenization protein HflD [Gammaproteobacteria bacterium]